MKYFAQKYDPIQFIVASDDLKWCKETFNNHRNVWIADVPHSAELDFALLVHCNHTIMTTGKKGMAF